MMNTRDIDDLEPSVESSCNILFVEDAERLSTVHDDSATKKHDDIVSPGLSIGARPEIDSMLELNTVTQINGITLGLAPVNKMCKIDKGNLTDIMIEAKAISEIDIMSESDFSNNKIHNGNGIDIMPKNETSTKTDEIHVASMTNSSEGSTSTINTASKIEVMSNINTIFSADGLFIDKSSDIDKPPRKLSRKRRAYGGPKCNPVVILAADRSASKQKSEGDFVEVTNVETHEDRAAGMSVSQRNFFMDLRCEGDLKKSAVNEKSKSAQMTEGSSLGMEITDAPPVDDKSSRIKGKRIKSSLKSSLERKMESMERILEDHVERILNENVEKHPWLQPIETWIVDHCKPPTTSYNVTQYQAEVNPPIVSRPTYNVKFTPARDDKEEAKIETRIIETKRIGESRIDSKMDKHRRNLLEVTTNSKSNTSELVNVNTQRENLETMSTCITNSEENIDTLIEPNSILELKEVKRHNHDLLDKLRDNVKEKFEDIHRYFQKTNRLADVNRRLKSQIWSSVVTIVLVEAKNLLPMDIDGLSDPYVKFRLGTEKYKSKVVNKTLNPIWLEQFDLHLYEDPYLGQELEVTVWDRDKSHQDDVMGRAVIDLATLERETTHRLWRELEDGSGSIFLLLTISGTTASETISDLAAHEDTPMERIQMIQRYSILNTLQRLRDVGHLTVKVYRAQGLAAADLGGKSDPFCVLELINSRLQTQTEYKTLAPNWQKIFTFNVKDINAVLEVTVYDEDRDHKVEFLGKVAIPLLKIRNGEKRWYALKDKKLRCRAKGNSPQILLEMTVLWNIFRACIRTLNPKEKKYMEPEVKFKRQVFLRNVLRLKAIIVIFIDIGKYIQSCWEWESKTRSVLALVIFILGCYYFEPYMIPAAALLILLKYYLVAAVTGAPLIYPSSQFQDHGEIGFDDGPPTPGDDDDDEDDKDKEEKKSLKERLQAIQEVTQTVQNSIGYIASLCERVKNLFNFTIPYLSYLAIILVIMGAVVLYFIPVRYLILIWGVNKFSRKILRPHSVPNNEVLDLISRVPDDEELLNFRELKSLPTADCEKSGTTGSPSSSNITRREQRKRHKAA